MPWSSKIQNLLFIRGSVALVELRGQPRWLPKAESGSMEYGVFTSDFRIKLSNRNRPRFVKYDSSRGRWPTQLIGPTVGQVGSYKCVFRRTLAKDRQVP